MALPPQYGDLGKDACDLFSKGFNFGDVKLDVSTTSASKTTFKAAATSHGDAADSSSRRVSGNLEIERKVFKSDDRDITVNCKLASDNTVNITSTANNFGVENLKIKATGNFAPHSGKHCGKVQGAYKRPYLHVTDDVVYQGDGFTATLSGVVKRCGFYAGYQASFKQQQGALTASNFALGYAAKDFTLHSTCLNHGTEFRGSLFHSINPKVDMGVSLRWAAGADGAHFGLASKYNCCPGVTLRSKFNSEGELGLSYKQELNPGVNVTMSALVDTKALALPSHRLGLALDFSA